jgi:hypothetical protein
MGEQTGETIELNDDYRINGEWIEQFRNGQWTPRAKVVGAIRLADAAIDQVIADASSAAAHPACAVLALRQAQAEWASEYDLVTREHPDSRKVRAALRMASELAGQRADALSTPPGQSAAGKADQ